MSITIRAAENTDIPSMAEIRARNSQTESFWAERITRYLRGEHSPQKALAPRTIFVALEAEELLGFVAGHRTTRFDCDGELQWIDVRKDKRGLGVGYELIKKMGEWFSGQHVARVCVNVDPANVPARALYAKCGAQPMNEHWMVWDDASKMKAQAR